MNPNIEWVETIPANALAIGLVLIAAVVHSFGTPPRYACSKRGRVRQARIDRSVLVLARCDARVAFMEPLEHVVSTERCQQVQSTAADSDVSSMLPFALAFANALTWISLSYSGFNAAVYMTDEIENPRRNVPRAMLFGNSDRHDPVYLLLNADLCLRAAIVRRFRKIEYRHDRSRRCGHMQLSVSGICAAGKYLGQFVLVVILTGLATSVLALMQTGPRVVSKNGD